MSRSAAPVRRRKGRAPTVEERALWDHVAATLRRRADTAVEPPPLPVAIKKSRIADDAPAPPPRGLTLRPEGRALPPVAFPGAETPAPSGLDRATETRLRKGRRAPDARIDLHGMTAEAAHRALNAFILRSRAEGRRCVLVITGKGGPHDGAPGVLRRETPHWLATPPLSTVIVSVSQAHPRHGGGGALYVYLKRAR